jgi:hypothetical protein
MTVAAGGDDPVETDAGPAEATITDTAPSETTPPATAPTESTVPDAPAASDVAATVAPESVREPETTAAPPAPSRADLVLRSNRVGNADFGMADIEYGVYVDFEETGFSAPFGRTTCCDNKCCLYFGGNTGDDLSVVGCSQRGFETASDPLSRRTASPSAPATQTISV